MSTSQIETLLAEHHDLAVREFKRVMSEVRALREEVKILRRIVASGEQLEFPWFKLPLPRRKQVEAVIAYLNQHKNREIYTLSRACVDTYEEIPGGYPNMESLRAYCYDIKLDKWLVV